MKFEVFFLLNLLVLINGQDYFYDESLNPEQIKEMQLNKTRLEEEQRKKVSTTTEKVPEWFQNQNSDDPLNKFMKEKFDEYLKKFKKEQKEKLRSRYKASTIDHSFWSVVSLIAFFGTGTLISLIVIVVKSNQMSNVSKREKSTKIKADYSPVNQNEINV
ncbi:hypothetical protein BpHYR1_006840 [Brachionus plicatilis]|uniref:Uncharacterized protein n=1 Tax=Brachionus plicatilis TaxID=10195 RepID=A0A3M7P981_BRAPC|nr:hypothetical protein BpHYR1_006840 [Brachionus plicatilis]